MKKSYFLVVGSVGCGKTSLILGILDEMNKSKGTVNVDGTVAYVSQQAWIQNETIRENILFGKKYDENFYRQVIHACGLVSDLAVFPSRDLTEIGEKVINIFFWKRNLKIFFFTLYLKINCN